MYVRTMYLLCKTCRIADEIIRVSSKYNQLLLASCFDLPRIHLNFSKCSKGKLTLGAFKRRNLCAMLVNASREPLFPTAQTTSRLWGGRKSFWYLLLSSRGSSLTLTKCRRTLAKGTTSPYWTCHLVNFAPQHFAHHRHLTATHRLWASDVDQIIARPSPSDKIICIRSTTNCEVMSCLSFFIMFRVTDKWRCLTGVLVTRNFHITL